MDVAVLRSSWAGQHINDRFPLQEWLGTIALGDVFRTELPEGQPAALLLASADDQNAAALLHNWQSAAALNHPHLARVFEAARAHVEDSAVVYIVTELPEEALGQILPERALTADEVREMLPPILDALTWLHAQGLVHGELTPANILVAGDQLKLAPYWLQPAGSFLPASEERPRIYDAPETDEGADAPLTPAANIWSLGILIIEALTQRTPTWMRSSGRDPLVPGTVPQPFAEIARRCLRFDPAQRCTPAEINELLSNASAQFADAEPAAPLLAATSAASAQLPLFDENATEAPKAVATEAPRLRKSFRTIEEEDEAPQLRFPIPYAIGAAALLILFIVGIVAYTHHGKKTLQSTEQPASTASAPADKLDKPIKPLPQPSGPTLKGGVAQRVIPEIPAHAARGIRGKVEVKIKVTVDHSGGVMNSAILSDGRSRYFANQALDAARKWRFRPAKIHGQPAASTWDLHFVFTKTGTDVTPVEVTP